MITCNLTKPEATFDQLKKAQDKLHPTEVALIATALVESGRYAKAKRDGKEFGYPDDHEDLTRVVMQEIEQIKQTLDEGEKKTKRKTKTTEAEDIMLDLELVPNVDAGEEYLAERKDLKPLFNQLLEEGVEYLFSPTDIQWQWSLERVNWFVASAGDLERRVKFRVVSSGDTTFTELGPGGKKRAKRK
ncbi:MAG: hypothetical protein ACOCX1_03420 [Fimbriimonadaceae bacterium]